jgi:hypothetical protein
MVTEALSRVMAMLTLNALIEVLDEKELIGKNEILERVKRLQTQTQSKKKPH